MAKKNMAMPNLPNFIFENEYESYLFFDDFVLGSERVTDAIQRVHSQIWGENPRISAFDLAYQTQLGSMSMNQGSTANILQSAIDQSAANAIPKNNIGYAICIKEVTGRWEIRQLHPTSLGVLAVNLSLAELMLHEEISDNFFTVDTVSWWLENDEKSVEALERLLNARFPNGARVLVKNYQGKIKDL